jgi:endoglycosylceramidase
MPSLPVASSRRRPPLRRGHRRERGGGPILWIALLLLPLAGVAWAYVPVDALTVSLPAVTEPQWSGAAWLHTAGGRIVDGSGRTVLLRGFDSDALLEDGVRHAPLDDEDATLIQREGFDAVRLPIAWSRLEPVRGRIDGGYLDLVAATVAMLERHGLRVVLEMHFLDWGPRFGGSGAPRWAALPLVPTAEWWPWESWRKHLSPAVNAAVTYFWLSPDWQADYETVWRAVAARFRGDPMLAGYDLYNEPHPLPIPPRIFEDHFMWPLYARTIAAIGAVDPGHLFLVEGTLVGDLGTTVRPLDAPDLVYSPHLYTGALVPPAFDGDRGPLDRRIAGQAAEAAAVPAPMWTGELGIDHHQAQAAGWADAALDALDDRGTGWAWWQWRESPSWGIRDAAGTFVDWDYLRHLARPYAAAAPPGVRAGRGDGVHGHLALTVDAGHGTAAVEIAWPAVTLGAPRATGDCLAGSTWDPGTARLTLTLLSARGCTVDIDGAAVLGLR